MTGVQTCALPICPMDLTRGFVQPDCYGYIPYIQLCLCYDAMGQWEKAAAYNEKAAAYKPDDASVAYNRAYFAQKRAENAMAQRSAKESVCAKAEQATLEREGGNHDG